MPIRLAVALIPLLLLTAAVPVVEAADVKPRRGAILVGEIRFARAQGMTIQTDRRDGSKLTVRMGFYGRCTGDVLREVWVSHVRSLPTVRVRDGRFEADLRATVEDIGNVRGRTGQFEWHLTGRFVERDVARASVSGTGVIRENGRRVIARCKIARPASVRLSVA